MITVFTPAYNRAKFLPRLFESLCKQTYQDFEWVIVDDGSTDGTKQLFQLNDNVNDNEVSSLSPIFNFQISNFNSFKVRYFYQENGGKHRAINRGVKEAKGELFFIVDSDDSLTADAIELISAYSCKMKDDSTVAGIGFMRCNSKGEKIGSKLNFDTLKCNAFELTYKHRASGDMAEVFRTKVLKEIPFPEFDGENFCPEALVWFRIADKYKMLWVNKCIYICEYLNGGLTSKIVRIRMDSPRTASLLYIEQLQRSIPIKEKLKSALNYWRFAFCDRSLSLGEKFRNVPFGYALLFPVGYLIHLYDLKRY